MAITIINLSSHSNRGGWMQAPAAPHVLRIYSAPVSKMKVQSSRNPVQSLYWNLEDLLVAYPVHPTSPRQCEEVVPNPIGLKSIQSLDVR